MNKTLLGAKAAALVANGFDEKDLTGIQRLLIKTGASLRIVSMDQGLVNSWNGDAWGLHYAADAPLNAALSADYSMLIIPGGRRSVDKLKLTAHTKRFISGFIDTRKPVAVFGEALELLASCGKISGRNVAGPENVRELAVAAGAAWVDAPYVIDGNIISGYAPAPEYAAAVCEFLSAGYSELDKVA